MLTFKRIVVNGTHGLHQLDVEETENLGRRTFRFTVVHPRSPLTIAL